MNKNFTPHFAFHSLLCVIALLFVISANAENDLDISLESDMVKIPAGAFLFGTNKKDTSAEALSLGIPKPWYADEGPEQIVFLKTFYIDRYEVSNRRYKKYIDNTNAVSPKGWTDNKFPVSKDDYPVINITWYNAANFCQWAEKKTTF